MTRRDVRNILIAALVVGVPIGIIQRVDHWGPWTLFLVTSAAMLVAGSIAFREPRGRR